MRDGVYTFNRFQLRIVQQIIGVSDFHYKHTSSVSGNLKDHYKIITEEKNQIVERKHTLI